MKKRWTKPLALLCAAALLISQGNIIPAQAKELQDFTPTQAGESRIEEEPQSEDTVNLYGEDTTDETPESDPGEEKSQESTPEGENTPEDDDSDEETTELQPAENLRWSDEIKGRAVFDNPNKGNILYCLYLFKDGLKISTSGGALYGPGEVETPTDFDIMETATYTFIVKFFGNGEEQDEDFESGCASEKSPEYNYERPEHEVGVPQNVRWDAQGNVTWDPVENARTYNAMLYKSGADNPYEIMGGAYHETGVSFSDQLAEGYNYYVRCRAISENIEKYAHGDYSDYIPFDDNFDEETAELLPAANIRWSEAINGRAVFYNPNKGNISYSLYLFKDGMKISTWGSALYGPGEVQTSTDFSIMESGTYTFIVKFFGYGVEQDEDFESGCISEESSKYVYVRPEQEVGVPQNVRWDAQGYVTWDPVDHARTYLAMLYRKGENNSYGTMGGTYHETGVSFLDQLAEGYDYYVRCRAISENIEKYAHGAYSGYIPFNINEIVSKINSTLQDIKDDLEKGIENAVEELKKAFADESEKKSLQAAMQTDETTQKLIGEFEESYKEEMGLTTKVSSSADSGVDDSKVKLLGAALNATEGGEIKFGMSKVDEETQKDLITNSRFNTAIVLDIELEGAGIMKGQTLAIPVTVTMPRPLGIVNLDKLAILHYNTDGSYDLLPVRLNADGTISFTVTHFSYFAFAEEAPIAVENVVLNKDKIELSIGNSVQLTAEITPKNADDQEITWTSENPAIAKVDTNGMVTAVSDGTTNIIAEAGGVQAICEVTVSGCEVIFDSQGGSEVASIRNVAVGSTITLPENPTRKGYLFAGWFTEINGSGDAFTAETVIQTSITVYAKWQKADNGDGNDDGNDGKDEDTRRLLPATGLKWTERGEGKFYNPNEASHFVAYLYYESDPDAIGTFHDGSTHSKGDVTYDLYHVIENYGKTGEYRFEVMAVYWNGDVEVRSELSESFYYTRPSVTLPKPKITVTRSGVIKCELTGAEKYVLGDDYGFNYLVFKGNTNNQIFQWGNNYSQINLSEVCAEFEEGYQYYIEVQTLSRKITQLISSDYTTYTLDMSGGIHIIGLERSYVYTGAKITPNIGVVDYDVDGGKLLVQGTDYTVSYKKNKNVGTAEVTITGKGNYKGQDLNAKFDIIKDENAKVPVESLNNASLTGLETGLTYDGEAKYPKFKLKLKGGTTTEYTYNKFKGVYETAEGEAIPAHVTLSNNINKGTATILLTGANDTKIKKTFQIKAASLQADTANVNVAVTPGTYAVNGAAPASVIVTYNGRKLRSGTDYTVKYSSNKKATTATALAKVTITGKGNYTKSLSEKYAIGQLDFSTITIEEVKAYKGLKVKNIKAKVVDGNGNTLKTSQYKLRIYTSATGDETYAAADKLETGSKIYVAAEAKDARNLSGTTPRQAFDVGANIANAKVKNSSGGSTITKEYTGFAITLNEDELQVKMGSEYLIMGTDYKIVSYSKNTNKGTASAVIMGTGNYSGTKTFTFKISAKTMEVGGRSNWDNVVNIFKALAR